MRCSRRARAPWRWRQPTREGLHSKASPAGERRTRLQTDEERRILMQHLRQRAAARSRCRIMNAMRLAPNATTRAPRSAITRIVMASIVALLAAAAALAARAQADDALPARVGRVANVQGMLRHSPEGSDAWSPIGL